MPGAAGDKLPAREVDRQECGVGCGGERSRGVLAAALPVVGVEELADRLAHGAGPVEVGLARGAEAAFAEPVAQPFAIMAEVDRIDEPLHQPERLRGCIRQVVPRRLAGHETPL